MRKGPYKLTIPSLTHEHHEWDEVMLHANFSILIDFMQYDDTNWTWNEDHKKIDKELKYLHKWWTVTRSARVNKAREQALLIHKEVYDPQKNKRYWALLEKSSEIDSRWDQEDQANLHRLVELRRYLWT